MRNSALLIAPVGVLISGLGVLYIKAHPIVGEVSPSFLIGLSYLPWLLAVIIISLLVQSILIRSKLDTYLFPVALFLSSVGIVEIARLKPALLVAQLRWLLAGMIVMVLVIRLYPTFRKILDYPYILGLSCLVVLILPLVFGTEIGGSKNWIVIGSFSIQPSEFGKILILLFLASYLSVHRRVLTLPTKRYFFLEIPPVRFIAPLICIWGIAVLLFVFARDLGSALLFFGMAIVMTYVATGNKSYIFLALGFIAVAAFASYRLFNHVRVRFQVWLDPWQDPSGAGYQIVQSLFSIGSGGVWGTGFGFGHPGFIPEVHTDFIFSSISEEMGLAGSLVIMIAFLCFFWRMIKIALYQSEEKSALIAAGIGILFFMQAFIIIGGVTKFLPLTGITLPFVSYGGSSMIASFFLLGMILSYSKGGSIG